MPTLKAETKEGVLALLSKHRKAVGSQKRLAEKIGVSSSYLSEVMRRHSEPSQKILTFLGLERVVVYMKKQTQEGVTR